MEILSFEHLPSTQRWLTEAIRRGEITEPTAVLAREQSDGMGSRENRWIGHPGNFFASIALRESDLPEDLPPSAASIYFGWVMRDLLRELGQPVWLKWPNDLYLGSKKAGGVITTRLRSFYVAGIGVNLKKSEKNFAALETELSPMILLDMYLQRLESVPKWKELFRKYRLEFERSRPFGTHRGAEFISLEKAQLMEDGSIMLDGERIVELR
ncbi:biotin--[acetyl-CoA-carboxylase] ligase [Nitratifractor sp.]|uniref:biotin--[acetyl-CoA-carboxylase] ligase n=1 Tax=Nitratifractor sp. TaxID=2268144 RepID=UPI0025EAAA12|nr:biotin--[acetyl-CoA-carboxylase] ligase [Nitratifractor sp.]